jgi:hypothetical protein
LQCTLPRSQHSSQERTSSLVMWPCMEASRERRTSGDVRQSASACATQVCLKGVLYLFEGHSGGGIVLVCVWRHQGTGVRQGARSRALLRAQLRCVQETVLWCIGDLGLVHPWCACAVAVYVCMYVCVCCTMPSHMFLGIRHTYAIHARPQQGWGELLSSLQGGCTALNEPALGASHLSAISTTAGCTLHQF